MKRVILLLALAALSGSALAHGGHRGGPRVSFGFHFGVPLYSPWYPAYYPAPYYSPYYSPYSPYYYPVAPVVVQPPAPPVYVERSDVVPEGSGTWYFCRESNSYYPYVKQCPGGWTRVPAQPSN
jgi:hypothetical protein